LRDRTSKFSFKNPVFRFGNVNKAVSVYRYSNVRTGIDATVTIVQLTGKLKFNNIDDPTTNPDAFQPNYRTFKNDNEFIE